MRGDLTDTTVPAICRSLASEGATGRLVIRGPGGPGTITLRRGGIADASSPLPRARLRERLTGGGHLDELTMARVVHELREGSTTSSAGMAPDDATLARGLLDRELADPVLVDSLLVAPVVDALVALLARREGEYRFEGKGPEEDGAPRSGVYLEVERALVEVERRSDELGALPAVTRSSDTIPLLLLDLPATAADFDADALTVLASIDDHSNLGEIARRVGYGAFDVAHVIAALYERSVVALTQPQAGLTRQEVGPVDPVQEGAGGTSGASHTGPPDLRADPDPSPRTPVDPARTGRHAPAATPAATAASDATAGSDEAPSTDRAAITNPAAATNGDRPHRFDDADDTDVSEFLRELSSLANRDDMRTRRTTSPAQTEGTGQRDPHDAEKAASGDDFRARSAGDDDAQAREEHRHQGPTPPSDDGRRKRRGLFGRS